VLPVKTTPQNIKPTYTTMGFNLYDKQVFAQLALETSQ
jgi:hypothetical protein